MGKLIDLTGKRFGKLVVECRAEDKHRKNGKPIAMWKCVCDCGNITIINGTYLRTGDTVSCGCLAKQIITDRNTKHNLSNTRIYKIWKDMNKRCNNPNHWANKYYRSKNISVCDEWKKDFKSFYEWSMNNGYSDNLTIDRIDVNGNYDPNNCRWATMKQQCNNKTNNKRYFYKGRSYTISELSDLSGLKYGTLALRLRNGWDIETAMTKPLMKGVVK